MVSSPPRKRQRKHIVLSSDDEIESPAPAKGRQKPQPQVQRTYKGERSLTTSRATSAATAGSSNRNGTLQLPLSTLPTRPSSQNLPPPPPPERSLNDVLKSPSKASSVHSTRTTPTSSPEKKRKNTARPKKNTGDENIGQAGKSLRSFFQPATEEERWSRLQREREREKEKERERQMFLELENDLLEDMIEDDDSLDEFLSQPRQKASQGGTSSFHGHPALDRRKSNPPPSQNGITLKPEKKARSGKRFILHTDSNDSGGSSQSTFASFGPSSAPAQAAGKPWAEQFAPVNLDELAVHKRKVADVQNWLNEVLIGRSRRSILVLKGPAGSGKTTTISLLSKALGYDIVEWRNSAGTEYSAQGYTSAGAQFDDFLGRGEKYNCLELDGETSSISSSSTALQSSKRRIMLVEEFPSSLSPGSPGLIAFRSALLRHAASSFPSIAARKAARPTETPNTPVVIIVSETLLGDGTSLSDSFTVHRLLGPELSNHPGVSIIEFNPIAPTFLTKALDLVLKKEARLSHRKRIPGPAVLKRLAEMGDVRSAISSLEFICLQGGDYEGYSGILNSRPKRSGKTAVPPTAMEAETLQMVTQREASLGIFHAVGKIMYNKREEPSPAPPARTGLRARKPPSQLGDHHDLVSQVSVEDLINETGTDIQTFLSALHENYPPSCHGDLFTESLDDCSEQLSAADILGIGSRRNAQSTRGIGSGRVAFQGAGTGIDILRQDEISFQVASRGLLYHLPYPVNRRGPDAHKMFYPSSIKLWRQAEEVDGLIALWMQRITTGCTDVSTPGTVPQRTEGVESWGIRARARQPHIQKESGPSSQGMTRCMISRDEVVLERLPYMRLLSKDMTERKEIERLTQPKGMIRRSQEVEEDDFQPGHNTPSVPTMGPFNKNRVWQPTLATSSITGLPAVEQGVDKLILSDDDIEDD